LVTIAVAAPVRPLEVPKMGGATTVAKKRAKVPKEMVVGIRGSAEWKEWIDAFAEHCRLNKVDIIDLALVDYARKMGFREPPKR
jgi:hypothetical protein